MTCSLSGADRHRTVFIRMRKRAVRYIWIISQCAQCHCKANYILTAQNGGSRRLAGFPLGGETAQRPARAGRRFRACAQAAHRYRLCDVRYGVAGRARTSMIDGFLHHSLGPHHPTDCRQHRGVGGVRTKGCGLPKIGCQLLAYDVVLVMQVLARPCHGCQELRIDLLDLLRIRQGGLRKIAAAGRPHQWMTVVQMATMTRGIVPRPASPLWPRD